MNKNVIPDNNVNDDPAKYNKVSRIPTWVKVLLLKYWAAGAAIFFIGMGGSFIGLDYSSLDYDDVLAILSYFERFFVMLALFLAIVMNYIVKKLVSMMHTSRNNAKYYNMVNLKGFKGFLVNFGYALLCLLPIMAVNVWISLDGRMQSLFGSSWGVEPFTMGLVYIFVDFIFLVIKHAIINYRHKRRFVKEEKLNEKL